MFALFEHMQLLVTSLETITKSMVGREVGVGEGIGRLTFCLFFLGNF